MHLYLDRKSTRLNSSHRCISYPSTLSLHDALPIFAFRRVRQRCGHHVSRDHYPTVLAFIKHNIDTEVEVHELGLCPRNRHVRVVINLAPPPGTGQAHAPLPRSEEHTSELQSPMYLVPLYAVPTRRSSDLRLPEGSPTVRASRFPGSLSDRSGVHKA